jgi:hypothetical protein
VKNGNENLRDDAAGCCASCFDAGTCTTWVWHPDSKECWLKREADVNARPAAEGASVRWTSGVVPRREGVRYALVEDASPPPPPPPRCVHAVLTSSGNPYMNWQTRIMYATYKKHARTRGSILKAFTRVLHRGRDDELMFEVPTMRFEPNQGNCDSWCDYPVADRSLAIAQWSKTTDSLRCSHVIMVETDYVFVKSPPPSIMLPRGSALGFQYAYIAPFEPNAKETYEEYMSDHPELTRQKFKLAPTGNAPSVVNVEDLRVIAPLWAEFVNRTEAPERRRKALGWLRDMYAYVLAALVTGITHETSPSPTSELMAQPPADGELGNAFILHYTWGPEIYDEKDAKIWEFDKRAYGGGQYKRGPYELTPIKEPPEWRFGLKLQTFFQPRALSESKLELLRLMVSELNEAIGALGRVPKGFRDLAAAEAAAA